MTTSESRRIDLHEDARKIELDLETNVDVRTVDRRTPPEREPTVRDLVQTGPLRVGELLVPHRLFEAGRLLPEQTYWKGKIEVKPKRSRTYPPKSGNKFP